MYKEEHMAKGKIQTMSNHLQAVQAHINQPARRSVDSTTVPSPDQLTSTSSLGTDTKQRTTTSESRCYIVMLLWCYWY